LLQHEALPHTIRSGQIHTIRALIEGGGADGMITMDQSLLTRVQDGSIEPKGAYLKAANKAPFAALLKPSELGVGHG
jgi:twitching motility protein PilT